MPGTADKHLSVVDICHAVGTVIVYKYWSLVHFPPTVAKCAQVKDITNCLLIKSKLVFARVSVCQINQS
jgi:hypothetical protein